MSYNAMGKFYHNLLMQALSKSGHKETVDFIKITDLVINIKHFLWNKTYNFNKIDQETKKRDSI